MPQPLKQALMLCSGIPRFSPWFADIFLGPRDIDLLKYARLSGAYGGHYVDTFMSEELRTDYSPRHPALDEVERHLEQYEPPEVLTAEQRRDLDGVMAAAAGDFKIGF